MRLFLFSMLFLLCASSPIGRASDVVYGIDFWSYTELFEFTETTDEKIALQFSIEVKDRVWIYKGIEESTKQAIARGVPSSATQRIRLEPSPEAVHVSYLVDFSEPAVRAPDWIDDGLWQRTKDVLHYGNEPRPSSPKPVEVFYFGPIGITR
jgi:hypothetical protein